MYSMSNAEETGETIPAYLIVTVLISSVLETRPVVRARESKVLVSGKLLVSDPG